MKSGKRFWGTASAAAALLLFAQAGFGGFPFGDAALRGAEAATLSGAKVTSAGTVQDAPAVIRGSAASIIHDSTRNSDVLHLAGNAFGSGWLQLPQLFSGDRSKGFSFSMQFKLQSDAADYTRLFQFATVPFGSGNTNGYNSPDISMDLNDGTSFRASVFPGKGSDATDADLRAIFNLDASHDTAWHTLTVSYAPGGAVYYLDGKALSADSSEGAGRLADACKALFGSNLLGGYDYCAVGHSLYSDKDLRADIDNVMFYDYALSASQAAALPDNPLYRYTFEADTVTAPDPQQAGEPENSNAPDGTAVTSIPEMQTVSPDGSLVMKIWRDSRGRYYYSADKDGDTVILPSRLGMTTDTADLASGFSVDPAEAAIEEHDETYDMPVGKHVHIRNHYYELTFPLAKGSDILTVYARVYDDGVGVRYALNHGATVKEEQTQVMFPGGSTFWGNWPNNTYEWDMVELPKDRPNETNATYSCPYTGVISDRYWVTVTEANVFNEETPYCAGALQFVGNYHSLRFKGGNKVRSISFNKPFHTPWRAVVIGDSLNQMASSDLILNLNPPSVLDDTSWVKPGKAAWSWWSSGGDSPVEYHMQKEYIDFAAENGWDCVCVDFGWALWDDSAAKIKELCDYGRQKGIGIWLWYGVNNTGHSGYKDSAGHPAYPYYSLLDKETIVREFERISGLGVQGVKVDYYESDTQDTMYQMYLCAKIAAENRLMVLFHGCTLPRGESRTFPNIVSYEAVNGTEYYKWFEAPSLANRVSYTFTRCVAGSADFTPTGIPIYGIGATAGFALADVVTIESGVQHFAHSVYTYEGSPALPLLNDIPVAWDDMHVIDGRPMAFNVTARRSGSDWYIGCSTLSARTVSIPLSELITDNGTYNAYIFGDNANGSALQVSVQTGLTKDSVIKQNLLKNGGCVIKLTGAAMNLSTPYSDYKFYEAEQAKLNGRASITSGSDAKYCSGSAYVGYVGGGRDNYVTFENVEAPADGEYTLRVYYVSGETRQLKVDVNGAFAGSLDQCYANRGDWKGVRAANLTVKLKGGKNTIKLYNDQSYGPSVDRIAVAIPHENWLIGDMNYDGKIDARDLTILKRDLMTSFPDKKAETVGDFDQDGKLTVSDARSMLNFLLGA